MITYRGTVYPWQCDHNGHMNVMWYAGKFDEATWPLLAELGLPNRRMKSENISMVAVDHRCEYKRELLAGDVITVRSFVLEVREKSIVFVHEMTNDATEELAARATIVGVCIDSQTRKARPLPHDVAKYALTLRRPISA